MVQWLWNYTNKCRGCGNLVARYQDKYQNNSYDYIFIFCDTDRATYDPFVDIKNKLNIFHGNEKAADTIMIFGNPCTMQIIKLHWDDVILTSHRKSVNA